MFRDLLYDQWKQSSGFSTKEKPVEVQTYGILEIESESHTAPALVARDVPGHFSTRK